MRRTHPLNHTLGLGLLVVTLMGCSSQDDPTCDKLLAKSDLFPIYAIGQTLNSQIVLITADHFVYHVNLDKLDSVQHQLHLEDSVAVSLANQWPYLFSDAVQLKLSQSKYGLYVHLDKASEGLLLILSDTMYVVNLSSNGMQQAVVGDVHFTQSKAWISDGQTGNSPQPYQIRASGASGPSLILNQVALVSDSFSLSYMGVDKFLCYGDSDNNTITLEIGDCKTFQLNNVQWPVKLGFVANGYFYLLGRDRMVYIIHQSVYKNGPNSKDHITKVSFQWFFKCPSDFSSSATTKRVSDATTNVTLRVTTVTKLTKTMKTTKRNSKINIETLLIVGIIILVIIAICICCVLLLCQPSQPGQQKNQGSKSRQTNRTKNRAAGEGESGQHDSKHSRGEPDAGVSGEDGVPSQSSGVPKIVPKIIGKQAKLGGSNSSKSKSTSRSNHKNQSHGKMQGRGTSAESRTSSKKCKQPPMISRGQMPKPMSKQKQLPAVGDSSSSSNAHPSSSSHQKKCRSARSLPKDTSARTVDART